VAAELYAQIGLRVGTSAAANYHASRVQAMNMKEGVIVTIFPCRGTDSDWEKIKQLL
jgi:cysteine synthase